MPLALGQSSIGSSDERLASKYFDEPALIAPSLDCRVKPVEPFLDFAFRFESGYVVRCPIREFEGKESTVLVFLRITPEGQSPVLLGEPYRLPAASDAVRSRTNILRMKDNFEFSGGFAAGEGHYRCEVLVVDKRSNRMYRTSWNASPALKRSERHVPLAIKANTVESMTSLPWKGPSSNGDSGFRVTVLLDVAPIYPYATKLRAWDRAFLLTTLSSSLAQIDCKSVKLVAFNLEQQKVVFSTNDFQPSAIPDLNYAMRSLELAKVSYQILQHPQGTSELLVNLAKQEKGESGSSEVVIFLGPQTRFFQKVPRDAIQPSGANPVFFYLEYMPPWVRGAEFPDTIEYLTKALAGTSFKIHSPDELATAIKKIGLETRQAENKRNGVGSP
ncbi:MAG: hypothetical protein JO065_04485 [Acidobacteria bacterium]|nr:hypothetical protein [Acidobacteriota bacterium]MBV9437619.1 hypothetical protein [Acidobacteriota bacterium]